jgi:hypothetical protein
MVDEIQSGIAPNPVHPTTNALGQPQPGQVGVNTEPHHEPPTTPPPPGGFTFMTSGVETVKTETPKVDHLTEIAELAKSLHNVSPSGAETVSAKILQHIADIKDPKAYDERMAAEKKASDEAVAASKKAKEAANKAA